MIDNRDVLELIELLNSHKVKYMLIGGYAVMHYTEPRYTKDIDFYTEATNENAKNIVNALSKFGVPKNQLREELFATSENFFKLGKPPWRVDFITSLKGIDFNEIYSKTSEISFGGLIIKIISKNDLIKVKELAGRTQDLLDVEKLKKAT